MDAAAPKRLGGSNRPSSFSPPLLHILLCIVVIACSAISLISSMLPGTSSLPEISDIPMVSREGKGVVVGGKGGADVTTNGAIAAAAVGGAGTTTSTRTVGEFFEGAMSQSKFTVVILTYRDSPCPCTIAQWRPLQDIIEEIIVVWDDPVEQFYEERTAEAMNFTTPVRFITDLPKSSLNNRYLIHGQIKTDAVFTIDDDIRIRHLGIRAAFNEWKRNPDLMIQYSRQDVAWNEKWKHFYSGNWPHNFNRSAILGLTMMGGTMLHKHYYELYSLQKDAMEFVDEIHNGEDILMNWVIAKDFQRRNVTGRGTSVFLYPYFSKLPAVSLPPGYTQKTGAISHQAGHMGRRTASLQKFIEIFGFTLTDHNDWSVGWMPGCTLEMGDCIFPFRDEPRLVAQTCEYSLEVNVDVQRRYIAMRS